VCVCVCVCVCDVCVTRSFMTEGIIAMEFSEVEFEFFIQFSCEIHNNVDYCVFFFNMAVIE
jgi:hypothetical protein